MKKVKIFIPNGKCCAKCCGDCIYLDRRSTNKYDEYYCVKDRKYHSGADSIAKYCRDYSER